MPIAGVEVVPLTMRRLCYLRIANNAFVSGNDKITPAHAAQFMWIVSRGFKPGDIAARDIFIRSIAKLPTADVFAGISAYLEDAFFDIESSSGSNRAPISSWEASVIDSLASEYGWTREAIMDLPVAEISQYLRLIEHRRGGSVVNPLSDGVKMAWLEQLNSRN